MPTAMTLKDLHDKLVEEMPAGAMHAAEECPFCTEQNSIDNDGGTMSGKTFSEDEVQALVTAAVAEATKELAKDLEDLKATQTVSEWEAKIEEAKAEAAAALEVVKTELDAKVIEAEEAKTAHGELLTFLESEKERVAAEEATAARLDERKAAVAEAIPAFPEEYLTENAERWASLDDDAFAALLADYKTVAEKATVSTSGIPTGTALHATRDSGTGSGKTSAARELIRMRSEGVDPRETIR